jgi:Ca-activated chloride channel family protein
MKRLLLIAATLLSILYVEAQSTGIIQGKITENSKAEPLPFVSLILFQDSIQVMSAQSDFDGNFIFKPLKPGVYELRAASVGFAPIRLTGIIVLKNETKVVNVIMNPTSIEMKEFVVKSYRNKLIDKGNTAVIKVNQSDYRKMARRSKKGVAKNTAGVYSYDNGSSNLNIRGARTEANAYYIDGMKVIGSQAPLGTENYATVTDNPYLDVISNPLSTFSIDVDKASYTNVRRFITQGYLPPADAVRIEEMVNYFSYDYPQPEGDVPFSISTEYTDCPWNPKHKLVHIGIQGKEIEMETAPSNNLVFLIDVSGSMNSSDKLGLLKTGLSLLVDQLRKEDRVAIVVYAGAAGLVLPSTSGADKRKIKSALNNLRAGGSTAGGAGIELAYKVAKRHFIEKGNNRIILASDGDFNVGISSQDQLIKLIESKRNDDIFLTTLGFGTGNLQDAKMEQLADKGNGNYNYIDNALEAKKVFVTELGANLITIAKDVKVQVEFNPAHVKGYRLIGYVNRKLNDEDFNDDTKDAGEIGSGHNVTMMYEIIPAGSDEKIVDIDKLKYQTESPKVELAILGSEVLTVKFRYKEPKGTTSMLIEEVLYDESVPFYETSENCRFSASVASFGMLLRKSDFKGDYDYKSVIKLAKDAKGNDEDGSRSEFIQLVKMVAVL